jgi:hypothetical protein
MESERKRLRRSCNSPEPCPQRKKATVDSIRIAHSKRTIFVDPHICEEISELTGIEHRVLISAFAGEEKNLALNVVKTVVTEKQKGTPEEWQHYVLQWAKENGSGEYRPGYWDGYKLTYEYNDYLRSIGRL